MRRLFLILLLLSSGLLAEDLHGIYENLGFVDYESAEDAAQAFEALLSLSPDFELLGQRSITPPSHIREKEEERDSFGGELFVLSDPLFLAALEEAHPRYTVAAFLKIGFNEEPDGVRMSMSQPETALRIVANDLEEGAYEALVARGAEASLRLRSLARDFGAPVPGEAMEPIRSTERLRKAKKDMIMMVGPMTYFLKEGQFPLLASWPLEEDADAQLRRIGDDLLAHLAGFEATEDDAGYHWTPDPERDLLWKVDAQVEIPGKALLLGLSRPRTEALAMHIAGMKRAGERNPSPGLDHICAFPIEVLLYVEGEEVQLRTAREMFRMDQYFWDAGKGAFMKFMNMPKMLDRSLRHALISE